MTGQELIDQYEAESAKLADAIVAAKAQRVKLRQQVEAERMKMKVGALPQAERDALAQALGVTSVPSSEAVGKIGG